MRSTKPSPWTFLIIYLFIIIICNCKIYIYFLNICIIYTQLFIVLYCMYITYILEKKNEKKIVDRSVSSSWPAAHAVLIRCRSFPVPPPTIRFYVFKAFLWQDCDCMEVFQPSWFKQWLFLYYDEANDVAYCHSCITGFKQGKMRASNADPAFVSVYTK